MTGNTEITDRPAGEVRALGLDDGDALRDYRERFVETTEDLVYFDGNSLGRPPKSTLERVERMVGQEWANELIKGWDTRGWMQLPTEIGDLLGRVAIGAEPGQVVFADSTSVCLFKLIIAALDARPGRSEILLEANDFPTDRFIAAGIAARDGRVVRTLRTDDVEGPTIADIAEAVGSQTALVVLSHTSYRSAAIADMKAINEVVHEAGAMVLWDLCHSVGSVPVELDATGTDLAVGCSYKYLNGGPGAPAFLYVNSSVRGEIVQPIWGWMGHADVFAMGPSYQANAGIRGMLSGTPSALSLACVQEGVRLVEEAGIGAIRSKGQALTDFALEIYDERLAPLGLGLASPRDRGRRGAHISFSHPEASRLCEEMIAAGVIPDFREPNLVRVGLSPLSTSFTDVWRGLDVLASLVREGA